MKKHLGGIKVAKAGLVPGFYTSHCSYPFGISVFDLRSNTEVRGLRVLLNQASGKFTV